MSDVQAWMDKLGGMQPEEIRKLMQDEGIKGQRILSRSCPIANFLKAKTGQHASIGFGSYAIVTYKSVPTRPSCTYWIMDDPKPNPQSVTEFVVNFDNDQYPELDADL